MSVNTYEQFTDDNNKGVGLPSDIKKVKSRGLIKSNSSGKDNSASLNSPTLNKRYRFSVVPTVNLFLFTHESRITTRTLFDLGALSLFYCKINFLQLN